MLESKRAKLDCCARKCIGSFLVSLTLKIGGIIGDNLCVDDSLDNMTMKWKMGYVYIFKIRK